MGSEEEVREEDPLDQSIPGINSGPTEDDEEILTELSTTRIVVLGTQSSNGTGWFATGMLIINAALGAGLLNFPQAFHQAGGLVVGISIQLVSHKLLLILKLAKSFRDLEIHRQ